MVLKTNPCKKCLLSVDQHNVLSLDAMAAENASDIEKRIYRAYTAFQRPHPYQYTE